MSPLVNLNSADVQPKGKVSEEDLMRTIAANADADTDWAGLGDFAPTYCPAPAEACTEIGADPVMPREEYYALSGPIRRHPRLSTALALIAIVLLLGMSAEEPHTADEFELLADELAAAEVQP